MSEIVKKINELREKYPEYAYMKYKIEEGRHKGEDWLVASMGVDSESNKDVQITTDGIRCSELTGTAKTDAELIVGLLNIFCNVKE